MIREIKNVKQKVHGQFRRWFTDEDMDLFVWFKNHVPVSFQLSYNKQGQEKAICWNTEDGFQIYTVDNGESNPLEYKMTPLYQPDIDFRSHEVARSFLLKSEYLEPSLADFIYARLLECPQHGNKHLSQDAVSNSL